MRWIDECSQADYAISGNRIQVQAETCRTNDDTARQPFRLLTSLFSVLRHLNTNNLVTRTDTVLLSSVTNKSFLRRAIEAHGLAAVDFESHPTDLKLYLDAQSNSGAKYLEIGLLYSKSSCPARLPHHQHHRHRSDTNKPT